MKRNESEREEKRMNWFEKMVQETEEERGEAIRGEKKPLRPRVKEAIEGHQILSTDDIPSYRPIPLYENERWPGNRHRRQQLEQRRSREQTKVEHIPEKQEVPTPSRAFRPSEVPSPIFGMRKKPEMPELSKEAREVRTRKNKPKGKATGDITQIEEKLTPLHDENKQSFVEHEQQMIEREVKKDEEEPIQSEMPTAIEQEEERAEEKQLVHVASTALEEEQSIYVESVTLAEEQPSTDESIALEEEQSSPVEADELKQETVTHVEQRVDRVEASEEEDERKEEQFEQIEEIVHEEERDELNEEVTEPVEKKHLEEDENEEESTLPFNVLMLSSDKRKLEMTEKIKRARGNV